MLMIKYQSFMFELIYIYYSIDEEVYLLILRSFYIILYDYNTKYVQFVVYLNKLNKKLLNELFNT